MISAHVVVVNPAQGLFKKNLCSRCRGIRQHCMQFLRFSQLADQFSQYDVFMTPLCLSIVICHVTFSSQPVTSHQAGTWHHPQHSSSKLQAKHRQPPDKHQASKLRDNISADIMYARDIDEAKKRSRPEDFFRSTVVEQ